MTTSRIHLSPPHVSGRERALLLDALDSNWLAPLGPHVDAFEREIAARTGVAHAVALSSGTAALHLALRILGVRDGDDVLTATLTFVATAAAATYVGAAPVFVDCDEATWNLDPDLLAGELASRARAGRLPKAVVAVDLYGQCADYERINAACEPYGVPVVEDAAESLGASYRDRPAGSLAAMGVLSFNGNKVITTSGGGMLLSDDPDHAARARFLATQARDPAPHYQHSELGYNYRMSNLLAAVGRGQLADLDERVERRRATNASYRRALGELPGVSFMPEAPYGRSNRWLTCVTIDPRGFGASRDDVRVHLESADIEARPLWKPLHLQPAFSGCPVVGGAVAEELFRHGLCLPSGSGLTDADLERIVDAFRSTPRRTGPGR
ncbi:MAG: aminotransferase class I/II-fold pyridoxal phosphate-dependent enzyme [Actinobacteria bacterium]|nr:aminotransferase class I/II-fold pyridoxal phosphate-dependent enzyme [Actinomycetota bacterium]